MYFKQKQNVCWYSIEPISQVEFLSTPELQILNTWMSIASGSFTFGL